MTAFFIPGLTDRAPTASAYQAMRHQLHQRLGNLPRDRQIRELWTRRGNLDCITTVGQPDPICGQIVMAIFDMGRHQPFVVYHQQSAGADTTYEVLEGNAYDVSEFDA